MSRADYAHWNEDADMMWWLEEGRHPSEPPDPPEPGDYDYDNRDYEDEEDEYEPDWEDIHDRRLDDEPPPGWEP